MSTNAGQFASDVDAVQLCAREAQKRGWSMFAVENGRECWTSSDAGKNYKKYGSSTLCKNGRGGPWALDVYQIDSK